MQQTTSKVLAGGFAPGDDVGLSHENHDAAVADSRVAEAGVPGEAAKVAHRMPPRRSVPAGAARRVAELVCAQMYAERWPRMPECA